MDSIDYRRQMFHLLGGAEQIRTAFEAGDQFSFAGVACEAPDLHGSMMDAPDLLAPGLFRD